MEHAETTGPRGASLATRILLGLAVGAALGTACNVALAPSPGAEASPGYARVVWIADNVANPVGQVFLRLLFMVVVPLVFCSLALGVAGIGSLKSLGRIGRRTILWFIGTTVLATLLGLFMVNAFRPGDAIDRPTADKVAAQFEQSAGALIQRAEEGTGFGIDTFLSIIPTNPLAAAADSRQALGLIFFALMVGIAMTFLAAERTRTLRDVLAAFYDICVVILGIAMRLAPLGVAGLIFAVTAKLGIAVLGALGSYLLVALGGLLLYQFLVLPALAYAFAAVSPRRLFAGARMLMVTAFSTLSSNATLPTTMRTAIDEFGVPRHIAGFVVPLGATMNMNGTALFEGVSVLFLAQVAGIDLSLGAQAVVVCLAVLTAIGTAGVPGGSLPLLAIVLGQVGVPPAMLALILGVDRLVDMTRTMPNVTSDLVCSMWIARREREAGTGTGAETGTAAG